MIFLAHVGCAQMDISWWKDLGPMIYVAPARLKCLHAKSATDSKQDVTSAKSHTIWFLQIVKLVILLVFIALHSIPVSVAMMDKDLEIKNASIANQLAVVFALRTLQYAQNVWKVVLILLANVNLVQVKDV